MDVIDSDGWLLNDMFTYGDGARPMENALFRYGSQYPSLDQERGMALGTGLSSHYLDKRRDANFERNISLFKAVPFAGFSGAALALGSPFLSSIMAAKSAGDFIGALVSQFDKEKAKDAQKMWARSGLPDRPNPDTFAGNQSDPSAYPYRRPTYKVRDEDAMTARLPAMADHISYAKDNWLSRSIRDDQIKLGYGDGGY